MVRREHHRLARRGSRYPAGIPAAGDFVAEIYSDAKDAAENPTHTVMETKKVNRTMRLKAAMVSGGGQAIRIRPAQ